MNNLNVHIEFDRWYDLFLKLTIGLKYFKLIKKKRVKKYLLSNQWKEKIEKTFLFNYIYQYLEGELPTLNEYIRSEKLLITTSCYFRLIIWRDEPCMGEDGPNPSEGAPVVLKRLRNDEYTHVMLEFHENKYSALKTSKICEFNLDPDKFSFFENEQYSLGFEFRFGIERLPRYGHVYATFDDENSSTGKCLLTYIDLPNHY